MEMLSDISLVTRVAVLHDRRAFDRLVRKYQSDVRRFFLTHTSGDPQLSDDLAQDTFVKAYTAIGSFRGMSSFRTWLLRIAYNVFYDYTRTHRITDSIDVSDVVGTGGRAVAGASSCVNDGDRGTLRIDLYDALARLKPVERSCITLQLIDGQSVASIAEITGLPQNTVKSHLLRGKERLAEYLKKNGYER